MDKRGPKGYWQCTGCASPHVVDRILLLSGACLEVHRLSCQRCGAIGHYDRDLTKLMSPVRSVNGLFRWVANKRPRAISLERRAAWLAEERPIAAGAAHG